MDRLPRLLCTVAVVALLPGVAFPQTAASAGGDRAPTAAPLSEADAAPTATVSTPPLAAQSTAPAAAAEASDLHAEQIPSAQAPASSEQGIEPSTEGPTTRAATAGIRANTAREDLTPQQMADRAAHHAGFGTDGALMIVGGAAFIAGLIIGGGAGTAVAIGGAVIGLYGLYMYLQ